jgi:Na+-driven multidrug efflux pump
MSQVAAPEPETPNPLWRLALPLIVSFTLRFLFSLVDLAYAAVLDDPNSVAAIGFWMPFNSVYIALWVGMSAGFTASISQAIGLAREDLVRGLKRAAIRLTALIVLGLIALGALFVLVILPTLELEQGLIDAVFTYGGILAIGWPLLSYASIYPDSIVKAHHDTRSTMIAGLLSTLSNVTLNTIFVFVFGWGIAGIAFGTVLSRIPSFVYAHRRATRLERKRLGEARQPDAEPGAELVRLASSLLQPHKRILWLGVPSTVTFLLTAMELGLFNRMLYELPNSRALYASFAAFHQLVMLSLMPTAATSVAVVPYVARVIAQGQVALVRGQLRTALLMCASLALLVSAIPAWLLPQQVAQFFVEADAQSLPPLVGERLDQARSIAAGAFWFLPLLALASVPFYLLRTSFEAFGRPTFGLFAGALRFALLSPPLIYLGATRADAVGLAPLEAMVLGLTIAALGASLFTAQRVRALLRSSE